MSECRKVLYLAVREAFQFGGRLVIAETHGDELAVLRNNAR